MRRISGTRMFSDGAERTKVMLWRRDFPQCVPDLGGGNRKSSAADGRESEGWYNETVGARGTEWASARYISNTVGWSQIPGRDATENFGSARRSWVSGSKNEWPDTSLVHIVVQQTLWFVCAISSVYKTVHDSVQTVNVSSMCSLFFLFHNFHCYVFLMGIEPATEIYWIEFRRYTEWVTCHAYEQFCLLSKKIFVMHSHRFSIDWWTVNSLV